MIRKILRVLVGVIALVASGMPAKAMQCEPGWASQAFALPGVDGRIDAVASGTVDGQHRLYIGGTFREAGGRDARFVAQWDGQAWGSLGAGVQGGVNAMAVYDDGSGPQLYVAGSLTQAGGVSVDGIARWDGQQWSAVVPLAGGLGGIDGVVYALHVFDVGTGSMLYAGGKFESAGGVVAKNIASWDGATWSPVGLGIGDLDAAVGVIGDYDTGDGPELIAGGSFDVAGSEAASNIARWDGFQWRPLGDGVDDFVSSLHAFDNGTGPSLYVGGDFERAGSTACDHSARWDGETWHPLTPGFETGPSGTVEAITSFDDGSGMALYLAGRFAQVGALNVGRVVRLSDGEWSAVGEGVAAPGSTPSGNGLVVHDDGSGPALVMIGSFMLADDRLARSIAFWRGREWLPEREDVFGIMDRVRDLVRFDDGGGEAVYAVGDFRFAGRRMVNGIAKRIDNGWAPLSDEVRNGVDGLAFTAAAVDEPRGAALYVGGQFTSAGGTDALNIARWDGGNWEALGDGLNGPVFDVCAFDDGSGTALFAVGDFTHSGNTELNHIGKWDGTAWCQVENSTGVGLRRAGNQVAVFDPGDGPRLYVAGEFLEIGSLSVKRIASWDGKVWRTLTGPAGEGIDRTGSGGNRVYRLLSVASGPLVGLYVGGSFDVAGGRIANRVARWDGQDWHPLESLLGNGIDGPAVRALALHDDGAGESIFVAGLFDGAGGVPASHVARWTGDAWRPLSGVGGEGVDNEVFALGEWSEGGELRLLVGGDLTRAGDVPSAGVALWKGCPEPCVADFDGDGVLTLFDYLNFSNAFHRGEPRADLDADGQFTLFDFLVFGDAFSAGCP